MEEDRYAAQGENNLQDLLNEMSTQWMPHRNAERAIQDRQFIPFTEQNNRCDYQ
jgi:hypothetical protein